MCKKLYVGEDMGFKKIDGNTMCTAKRGCSGPIFGGCFEEYEGDLSRDALAFRCYVCGTPSRYVLKPKGNISSPIGICETHLPFVKKRCDAGERNGEIVLMIAEANTIQKYEVIE